MPPNYTNRLIVIKRCRNGLQICICIEHLHRRNDASRTQETGNNTETQTDNIQANITENVGEETLQSDVTENTETHGHVESSPAFSETTESAENTSEYLDLNEYTPFVDQLEVNIETGC